MKEREDIHTPVEGWSTVRNYQICFTLIGFAAPLFIILAVHPTSNMDYTPIVIGLTMSLPARFISWLIGWKLFSSHSEDPTVTYVTQAVIVVGDGLAGLLLGSLVGFLVVSFKKWKKTAKNQ
jgi:hypothetical protein